MSVLALTVYTLIWPAILFVVAVVIARAFLREWRQARREGNDLI